MPVEDARYFERVSIVFSVAPFIVKRATAVNAIGIGVFVTSAADIV
jgi:hypothetical protein